MSKEKLIELGFDERALIACLTVPILDWNDEKRLDELCAEMVAGDKGVADRATGAEFKKYIKVELKNLRDKLGF